MFSEAELNDLYRYSLTLANDESNAYDLLQDSLESYLKKQTNQTIEKPLQYIRQIIRNRFFDMLRREKVNPVTLVEDTDDYPVTEIGFQSLEQIQITRQTLENIWKKLQPLERELMHFWAVENWTAQEIAEHLQLSRGTILARVHRLRKRILAFDVECNTSNREAG